MQIMLIVFFCSFLNLFLIKEQLLYNIVFASAVQCELAISIYMSPPP